MHSRPLRQRLPRPMKYVQPMRATVSELIRKPGRLILRGLCIPSGVLAVTALVSELGAVPGVERIAAVRPGAGEIEIEGAPAHQDVVSAIESARSLMAELRDEGFAQEVGACSGVLADATRIAARSAGV